ncbi:hypothetical protein [Dactylosporangium darangshiense]|uniref:hypothetical protein n=1 Tax=Dactylosporangium darangshiense TaxID=579108 RepID=UPI0031E8DE3E
MSLRTNCPGAYRQALDTLYSYKRGAEAAARWSVDVRCDPTLDVGDAAGITGEVVEIGPKLFASARSTPTGRVYWVSDLQTMIALHRAYRLITVQCATEQAARHWAPRLIRQAMTAQLLGDGAVYAHAAAFTHSGRGVVIAGHRRRGKTTTLLAALHRLGGNYVTNDRLLLRCTGSELVGYPWPMHLRAGIGTLTALPHLAGLVPEHLRRLPLVERWTYPDKVAVEPPDFPRLMQAGGTVAGEIRPAVLLWPDLEADRTHVVTEGISPQAALTELLRSELFMTDPGRAVSAHVNHWLIPAPDPAVTAGYRRAVALALTDLPCYRIRAGSDPIALAEAVGAILDRMPRRRGEP